MFGRFKQTTYFVAFNIDLIVNGIISLSTVSDNASIIMNTPFLFMKIAFVLLGSNVAGLLLEES